MLTIALWQMNECMIGGPVRTDAFVNLSTPATTKLMPAGAYASFMTFIWAVRTEDSTSPSATSPAPAEETPLGAGFRLRCAAALKHMVAHTHRCCCLTVSCAKGMATRGAVLSGNLQKRGLPGAGRNKMHGQNTKPGRSTHYDRHRHDARVVTKPLAMIRQG